MKDSLKAVLAIVLVSFALSGCATVATPALGWIYADVKYGDTATTATNVSKTGTACAQSFLGLISMGDASIAAAKAAGGITTVSSVDHTARHIVVWGEWCTVVKGN
jgi:hypothetical protein